MRTLPMSAEDIAREYRQAASQTKQIGILADLNACTKKEIAEVLLEQGCEVPKWYTKKENTAEAPDPEPEKEEKERMPITYLSAGALFVLLSEIRDADDMREMAVTINGKRAKGAAIIGEWSCRDDRIRWELTVEV